MTYSQGINFILNSKEIDQFFYLFLKDKGFCEYPNPTSKQNCFYFSVTKVAKQEQVSFIFNVPIEELFSLGADWCEICSAKQNDKWCFTKKDFYRKYFKNVLLPEELIDKYIATLKTKLIT